MTNGQFKHNDPVYLTAVNGTNIDITALFWNVVNEARYIESYGRGPKDIVDKSARLIAAAAGPDILIPILDKMQPFIPDWYEVMLRKAWKAVKDEHDKDNEEDED